MGSYVGIDLHRRRSVVVVLNEDGDRVSWCRIDNTPANLAAEIVAAGGAEAEVAMEARWGWYWAADVIAECGARLHLAHPLGIAGYENRRVKNDIRDATLLADLLRLGRLPEAWVAPPEVRELREMVRYRAKLGRLRSGLKAAGPSDARQRRGDPRARLDLARRRQRSGSTSCSWATSTSIGSSRCAI